MGSNDMSIGDYIEAQGVSITLHVLSSVEMRQFF